MLLSLPYFHSFAPGVCRAHPNSNLAGAEGFEPPSSVLETDSLAVELTPLFSGVRVQGSVWFYLRVPPSFTRRNFN